jgi:hypothetical protein
MAQKKTWSKPIIKNEVSVKDVIKTPVTMPNS